MDTNSWCICWSHQLWPRGSKRPPFLRGRMVWMLLEALGSFSSLYPFSFSMPSPTRMVTLELWAHSRATLPNPSPQKKQNSICWSSVVSVWWRNMSAWWKDLSITWSKVWFSFKNQRRCASAEAWAWILFAFRFSENGIFVFSSLLVDVVMLPLCYRSTMIADFSMAQQVVFLWIASHQFQLLVQMLIEEVAALEVY